MTLTDDAFVFSYGPDHQRHCDPDATTHRYSRMTAALGIDTHLHALRHHSATELIGGHCCIEAKGVLAMHQSSEAGPSGTLENRNKPGI